MRLQLFLVMFCLFVGTMRPSAFHVASASPACLASLSIGCSSSWLRWLTRLSQVASIKCVITVVELTLSARVKILVKVEIMPKIPPTISGAERTFRGRLGDAMSKMLLRRIGFASTLYVPEYLPPNDHNIRLLKGQQCCQLGFVARS